MRIKNILVAQIDHGYVVIKNIHQDLYVVETDVWIFLKMLTIVGYVGFVVQLLVIGVVVMVFVQT